MKKEIFNLYVKLICDGTGLVKDQLFSPLKNRDLIQARILLYKLCYDRPMTIKQIVSFMKERGFIISYETVRKSIIKTTSLLKSKSDKDFNDFFNRCLEKAEKCC
tara:strand:- start:448 stop:762 length:315 start_codon:yes stop_codon:yes gene_type:complete